MRRPKTKAKPKGTLAQLKCDPGALLGEGAGICAACIQRIFDALQQKHGVTRAHLDREEPLTPKLCFHYDPVQIGPDQVDRAIEEIAAAVLERYDHLPVPKAILRSDRQARIVRNAFAKREGVLLASTVAGPERLLIDFERSKTSRLRLMWSLMWTGLRRNK